MVPLADVHVHLLAGLDDGPRTQDEALAMCRMLVAEGARSATATAHQNDGFPENTPERILAATALLADLIREQGIPLSVVPTGEIVLTDDLAERWKAGRLMSIGNLGKYLLVEMPYGSFADFRPAALALAPLGVRIVVAHAERYESLLHDPDLAAEWIAAGLLMQATAEALADPPGDDGPAMKLWVERGMFHLLGSDGHRIDRRKPELRDGYEQLKKWGGAASAERAGLWGTAVLQGLPINPPALKSPPKGWFTKLFG